MSALRGFLRRHALVAGVVTAVSGPEQLSRTQPRQVEAG